jgi:prevent-host-death family protein
MKKSVSAVEARQKLGEILNRVALKREEIIVERAGKRIARLLPAESDPPRSKGKLDFRKAADLGKEIWNNIDADVYLRKERGEWVYGTIHILFRAASGLFSALELFFNQLYETGSQAITSIITYTELATQPARQGKKQLVRRYRDCPTNSENIGLFPLDLNIADHVVELRSQYQLRTPDAIQNGTAIACGADYIITNETTWRKFEKIRVIPVGEL